MYFITSNRHKVEEIQKMTDIHIEQKPLPYPEIQTDTLEKVAVYGINYCYTRLSEPCFIEDSGLFIDALSGFPGVYSKYVYTTIGCEGILRLLDTPRTASFKSVIAYKDTEVNLFIGTVKGVITHRKKGDKGFGFDPVFLPHGERKTFAQMEPEEKNLYSHRGKAFKAFLRYLEQVR